MIAEPSVNSGSHFVRFLGAPLIEDSGGVLEGPAAQRHRIALLALLVVAPQATFSRERILGLLWPHASTSNGRHLLNAAVHAIRHALGMHVLRTHGQTLSLDSSSLRIDVQQFEAALRAGNVIEAIELYSGPFLDGFGLPDAVEFEHWQDLERERLERLYLTALEQHAEALARTSCPAEAVPWLRRRLALTPTDSRITLRLMEYLAAAGDRASAIQAAEVHATLLRTEFEAEPDPEVARLAAELRHARGGLGAGVHHDAHATDDAPTFNPGIGTGETNAERHTGVAAALPRRETQSDLGDRAFDTRRIRRSHVLYAATVALGLAAIGFVASPWIGGGATSTRERVVVIPFENQTDDPTLDDFGVQAADFIHGGISAADLTQVVSFIDVVSAARDSANVGVALNLARTWPGATGGTLAVLGAFYTVGDSIEFRLEIVDRDGITRGKVLPIRGASGDPSAALETLQSQVVRTLAEVVSPSRQHQLSYTAQGRIPPKLEAQQQLLEGWTVFAGVGFEASIPYLERAIALDSNYVVPLIVLRSAYANLGRWAEADSVCRIIQSKIDGEIRMRRLEAELFCPQMRTGQRTSYEIARDLADLDAAHNYILGLKLIDANRPREAVEAFAKYDTTRGSITREWEDTNAYVWAVALHMLGEHIRELDVVRETRKRFPHYALLIRQEISALIALERYDEARRMIDRRLWDVREPGTLLLVTGQEFDAHGRPDIARSLWERALNWYSARRPDELQTASNREWRAEFLVRLDRLTEAERLLVPLAAEFADYIDYTGLLGVLKARLGDREASDRIADALAVWEQPVRPSGRNTLWRARIATQLGDVNGAVRWLERAMEEGWLVRDVPHRDDFLKPLRGHSAFEAFVRPKG